MITGNEPAFADPARGTLQSQDNQTPIGLTKREYFAAKAMQGILSNAYFLERYADEDIHKVAVQNADALIDELNKETK